MAPLLPRPLLIPMLVLAILLLGIMFRLWPVYDRGEMAQVRFDALLAQVYAGDPTPEAFIDFTGWASLDDTPHPFIRVSWFHRVFIGDASVYDVIGIGPFCYPIASYSMSLTQFSARNAAESAQWNRYIDRLAQAHHA